MQTLSVLGAHSVVIDESNLAAKQLYVRVYDKDNNQIAAVTVSTDRTNGVVTIKMLPPPPPTISAAPNGPALITAAGSWEWSSAAAGRPGEYYVNLNGTPKGIGLLMEVTAGGKFYVKTANAGWYLWQGGGWVYSTGPGAPPPPPKSLVLSISLAAPRVIDNSPGGTVVGTVSVSYADGTVPAAVTLTSSDPLISVRGMQLVTSRQLTSADDGVHNTMITASDGLGTTASLRVFEGGPS